MEGRPYVTRKGGGGVLHSIEVGIEKPVEG